MLGLRLERVGEAGPGDAHVLGVAEALLAVAWTAGERDAIAGLELDDVVAQRADPQLRAGQVLEDRHRASGAPRGVAHAVDGLGVLVERAVGVVQPRDVHPRLDHPQQGRGLARGGADGGDDLRAAHARKVSIGGSSRVCAGMRRVGRRGSFEIYVAKSGPVLYGSRDESPEPIELTRRARRATGV